MKSNFYKYQATGNDFVIIDNRDMRFNKENSTRISELCNRRFGIGADGLIVLQNLTGYDFEMLYYNSDGKPGSLCGNGGRCIVALAHKLGIITEKARFIAMDGEHRAIIKDDWICLKMNDVSDIERNSDFYFLNTGSPHYVKFVKDIHHFDVSDSGKTIRFSDRFKAQGTNVDFIEKEKDFLFVRTYERGVEGETFSCGTGVTAAALVAALTNSLGNAEMCAVKTMGGNLTVRFNQKKDNSFDNIWLEGPVSFVFKGEVEI